MKRLPIMQTHTMADTALAFIGSPKEIFSCQRMSAEAMSFSGILRGWIIGSHNIYKCRNALQVFWVKARLLATEVVKHWPGWANQQFICYDMNSAIAPSPIGMFNINLAVALPEFSASPNPAWGAMATIFDRSASKQSLSECTLNFGQLGFSFNPIARGGGVLSAVAPLYGRLVNDSS